MSWTQRDDDEPDQASIRPDAMRVDLLAALASVLRASQTLSGALWAGSGCDPKRHGAARRTEGGEAGAGNPRLSSGRALPPVTLCRESFILQTVYSVAWSLSSISGLPASAGLEVPVCGCIPAEVLTTF